jgi:hypothetical protein
VPGVSFIVETHFYFAAIEKASAENLVQYFFQD